MPDLIGAGLAWLYGQLKTNASITVIYRRVSANNSSSGDVDIVDVQSVLGKATGVAVSSATGAPADPRKSPRDFMVLAADLAISGNPILPAVNDLILETIGDVQTTYIVAAPPLGGPCFDYGTGYRDGSTAWLTIHTKFSGS